jgi:hypothetical protein
MITKTPLSEKEELVNVPKRFLTKDDLPELPESEYPVVIPRKHGTTPNR